MAGDHQQELLEAKTGLQRMLVEIPLTDNERAAVEGDQDAVGRLIDLLADVAIANSPRNRRPSHRRLIGGQAMLSDRVRLGGQLRDQQSETKQRQRDAGESLGALAHALPDPGAQPHPGLGHHERLDGDQRDHRHDRDAQQTEREPDRELVQADRDPERDRRATPPPCSDRSSRPSSSAISTWIAKANRTAIAT